MSPSDQLSSPVDSSLSHSQRQHLRIVSLFQLSLVYKQANSSQIIQYRLCSCLDNSSSSPSLHLTNACCSWMPCPEEKTLFLRCLSRLPRGRKLLLRKSTCSVAEAPDVPTKRLQVATSQVRPVPVFSTASQHFLVVQHCVKVTQFSDNSLKNNT